MTGYSFSTPVWDGRTWVRPAVAEVAAAPKVNGPEDQPRERDAPAEWDKIDWREQEGQVRRLRQRIFKASQEQDWPKVRNLQKLMLRSRANTLVSVRQVTQRNAGRKTAGIDGEVALTSEARAQVAVRVHQSASSWTPVAVKRVHIPKASNPAKLRPLGIPVLMDRCHQARVRNALEPEWEARFEPRSYGFRPGRGCHDAIEAIYAVCKGPGSKRVWILDADLAAAFDKIDHSRLLQALGSFPARDLIRGWLKAGVFEAGKGFAPTEEGTPQGGVISPCLLNVALHGLEGAAGVRYRTAGVHAGETEPGSPVVIRYADDVAVLCHSQGQAQQVKARLAKWLAPRGLSFNEDKTKVVHLTEGFDFLGASVRRYPGGKLLIKPSKAAIRRLRERLAAETRALRGANATAVIARLSPITRGWAAYYRTVVSAEVFSALDHYAFKLTYKWAKYRHPNKPKRWIVGRYFGRVQHVQERPLGVRRPRQRRPPGEVRLDQHQPARHGQGRGVPRRPRPGRLLGQSATAQQAPAGQLHARPAHQARRALSALRGPPAHRRPAAAVPAAVGTMVASGHPQGDSRQLPRPPRETRPRRSRHDPPRARILPSRAPGPPAREPSTADLHALAACLSCLRRKPHGQF